jgi:hypothetical protein
MADDYTARKLRWLDQVAADETLKPSAFLLAWHIASHVNRQKGFAYPSQERLSDLIRMDVRMVRLLCRQLEAQGHIATTPSKRGVNTEYRIKLNGVATSDDIADEPAIEQQTKGAAKPPKVGDDEFDAWWLQYPRKVSRGAARKAYDKARGAGATADELLNGAMRYAAERSNEDPKYTKHGATWLNGECWRDEQAPQQSRGALDRPHGRPQPLSHLENAIAGFKGDRDE